MILSSLKKINVDNMSNNLLFIVVENRVNETIKCCLESARRANEEVHVVDSVDGGAKFDDFKNHYIHLSTNSEIFELICFRRYFLLRNFLEENISVNEFVLIDSDVLLFEGASSHINAISQNDSFMGSIISYDESESMQISPHVSYWTRSGLFDFVEFLIGTYKSIEDKSRLNDINDKFIKSGRRGGVSDMTLLYLWARSKGFNRPINIVNAGVVVDHNISISDNYFEKEFKLNFGTKKIVFNAGRPYFLRNNEEVSSVVLHFQGRAKILMPYILGENLLILNFLSILLYAGRNWKKRKYQALLFVKNL